MENDGLLSCPHCGCEAEYVSQHAKGERWAVACTMTSKTAADDGVPMCRCRTPFFKDKGQARDVWNNRVPVEYDGWFYLPKPKEAVVCEAPYRLEITENGCRANRCVEVVESAIRAWGDELGERVMKRICEVWSAPGVRTCRNATKNGYGYRFECSACGYVAIVQNCDTRLDELPNHCPNCGRKVLNV